MNHSIIQARSGAAFLLEEGRRLKVSSPLGEQVSDLICYNAIDRKEVLSSGRTLDYASKLYLSTGDKFYSNRSAVMFEILADSCGRHDFLLTPCSKETFRIIYGNKDPHRGCFGNLVHHLGSFGICPDEIPTTFNIFMNVEISADGRIQVKPPLSRPGDYIVIQAKMDLVVGLTACAAEQSNNGTFKPISYEIF